MFISLQQCDKDEEKTDLAAEDWRGGVGVCHLCLLSAQTFFYTGESHLEQETYFSYLPIVSLQSRRTSCVK